MMNYLNNYDQRIHFLRSQGDQLFESIKALEIRMNRRKQQNEEVALGNFPFCHVTRFCLHSCRYVNKFVYTAV